ncbi:hypothetical protein [Serratia sp. UGAL515B_01]|uniref:hypothetical protein n=1 Tax=Serratia sp. UGAL515B_01 TaxID=2986763 RepID=UPI0029534B98|nr:hypothetical protein [Serratia sp. UGAL515B_01]WON78198.1 hypothetical protein OK023_05885 [Serratia sp. UGAL515B_01]
MNTAHEIIGCIVEELILENSLIDYDIIKERAMIEFILSDSSSRTIEEKQQYKKMLKIFTIRYRQLIE